MIMVSQRVYIQRVCVTQMYICMTSSVLVYALSYQYLLMYNLPISLSVYLSIHACIHPPIYLSLFPSLSISLSLSLSLSLSISLLLSLSLTAICLVEMKSTTTPKQPQCREIRNTCSSRTTYHYMLCRKPTTIPPPNQKLQMRSDAPLPQAKVDLMRPIHIQVHVRQPTTIKLGSGRLA